MDKPARHAGVIRPVREMGLVERSRAFAVLDEALTAAATAGRLVLIAGEAGVGKTALVTRFCETHSTVRVAAGACDALFTPRALGPLLGIADSLGGRLVELVASGARPHEVVTALIDGLRAAGPVIVVIEDAHWADQATLDVLRLLGRSIGAANTLVLVTYRDDELGRTHPLRLVLGELPTGGAVERMQLEPLTSAGVAALAAGDESIDVAEVYRLTGGNPFFVTEILAGGNRLIPPTARDAVLARVGRLSTGAAAVLDAVSVVPGRVEVGVLEAIAGPAAGRLAECLAAGVLVSTGSGVAFRHELARLAVEESLPPDRRVRLNRAALRACVDDPMTAADFARLAHHAEQALDAEAVLKYAPAAAERASALGAHREAAAQYARGLRFAGTASATQRARLLQGRAQECYLSGRFDLAINAQREVYELHRELGDRPAQGESLSMLARLRFYAGQVPEARALARQAVTFLEGLADPGRELAWAYSTVAMLEEDLDTVRTHGDKAVQLAIAMNHPEVHSHALTNVGFHELMCGIGAGRPKLDRSLDIALESRLEEATVRAYSLLCMALVQNRTYVDAEEMLDRAIAYSTERDLASHRLLQVAHRARVDLDLGRWDEAMATETFALRERTRPYAVFALPVIALVRARRGDPDVWPLLDEAQQLAPDDELLRSTPLATARAEAAWLGGRDAAAVRHTQTLFDLAVRKRYLTAAGELACWRWRAGVRETLPDGLAEHHAAQVSGDWQRAARAWADLGCRYEAALALAEADTNEPLREAYTELTALGARPAAEIVARRLRERGARDIPRGPRRTTRHNPAGLTPRELEVLRLVAEGLRNVEIADRLFLSGKTVDHHMTAILAKLGARTRGEAVAKATKLGAFAAKGR